MTPSTDAPKSQVAVVMRTHNRPVMLRRALQSVLAQTYDDFVVVVVNDAGEPGPVEDVVTSFADRGGRIHVVHNEVSRGREAALNPGIAASDSTYVAIHDDDDTWAPSFLEQTVAYLDRSADHGVATRTEVIHEQVDGDGLTELRREILAPDKSAVTLYDVIQRNFVPPISLLYRRAVHDEVGLYDESLPVLADWDFLLRLLRRFTVGFLDGEPLAFWHHRPEAIGDIGNSVIAGSVEHHAYDRAIRERYLRADIEHGNVLGVLLYITDLMDQRSQAAEGRALHLEHRIGDVRWEVEHRVADAQGRLEQGIAGVRTELLQLNQNLVAQNNRIVAQFQLLDEKFASIEGRVAAVEQLVWSQTPRVRARKYKQIAFGRIERLKSRRR